MAVKTLTPKLDHTSLREALDRIANQPDHLAWALAAVGFLYGDLAKQSSGCPPIGDTLGTPLKFRFGDFPHTTTSDTPSDETRRATEEKKITPDHVVQIAETRTGASDAKKLKGNIKMWKERKLEDDEIFGEIKELSAALGLEKTPCSRHHTRHHKLVKVLAGLKEDLTQQKKKTAAQKAADDAAQAAAEKKPSPRGQADNHSVGPSNMITLNSVGQTSKSPPDNEDVGIATRRNASTNSGAENEQTTSQQMAAAEKTAAAERTTGSTEKEQNPSPQGTLQTSSTSSDGTTNAEKNVKKKNDSDGSNDNTTAEKDEKKNDSDGMHGSAFTRGKKQGLAELLETLLSPESLSQPWMIDEMVSTRDMTGLWGISWPFLEEYPGIHWEYTEQEIRAAAEASPHMSAITEEDYRDKEVLIICPGDGHYSYGEYELLEDPDPEDPDDPGFPQRWIPSAGDPRPWPKPGPFDYSKFHRRGYGYTWQDYRTCAPSESRGCDQDDIYLDFEDDHLDY